MAAMSSSGAEETIRLAKTAEIWSGWLGIYRQKIAREGKDGKLKLPTNTAAIGWFLDAPNIKLVACVQNTNLAKQEAKVPVVDEDDYEDDDAYEAAADKAWDSKEGWAALVGFYPPPKFMYTEKRYDAREYCFSFPLKDDYWRASDSAGVHAEAFIIRAWVIDLLQTGKCSDAKDALNKLRGRAVIASSVPPCWCCEAYMHSLGIVYHGTGTKPLTGWRHPLGTVTIPNADIPDKAAISACLEKWRAYKGGS